MDSSKFSHDMNMEILSRTSLTTLDTMRCTNKELEELSYNPYFLNLYKQRNNILSGFLVRKGRRGFDYTYEFAPAPESKTLNLGFLPENVEILASSEHGIILLETTTLPSVSYHVCKPSTKQVLKLPNPKTKYLTLRVAMVVISSKPLHYKILRLSQPKPNEHKYAQSTTYLCEVFNSKTWAWRQQDLLMLPSSIILCDHEPPPIVTKGSIYMLLENKKILKFDAYSEKWTTFWSPSETINYDLSVYERKLVKYKSELGFVCKRPSVGSWEIWVHRSVDGSWEKVEMKEDEVGVDAIYDSETRVVKEGRTLVFNKFKGGIIRGDDDYKWQMFEGGYHLCRIFPFRSDFELVDLRGLS